MKIDGDYFIRFGEYGENKFEIESRLCEFLIDIYNNNQNNSNILIVSHGSIISYIKRIFELDSNHIKKGQIEKFSDVNFNILVQYM